jgi:DnaJ-class molecular chaperone
MPPDIGILGSANKEYRAQPTMSSATEKDYYELLGVGRKARTDEIKLAYRDLARIYHPDSNFYADIIDTPLSAKDEDTFKRINLAYETLMDAEKRAAYDRTLLTGIQGWNEGEDSVSRPQSTEQWEKSKSPQASRVSAHTPFGKGRREDTVSRSSAHSLRPMADFLQSTKRTVADKLLLFIGLGLPLLTLAGVAIYLFWFAKKT